MIDFSNLEKYRENNRIEAKKALGGLPKSLWETYSAFANTLGGIILLGVEELADKSLRSVNLPNPEKWIEEFWEIINNPQKTSVNILSGSNVTIENIEGNRIIAITIPRAQRYDRPVYLEGNPLTGTYRRDGEGDYKCTKEEVQAMLRDAALKTQDMAVLDKMDLAVFDYDSVHRYRTRMKNCRPLHAWEQEKDVDFLYKLGAVGRSEDEKMHPTAAGLLMFGCEYEIIKEFPGYFLDYQEQMGEDAHWTDRILSSSGEWSGNIYDFYFKVYERLAQEDAPVHKALGEALANCLINADYYGRQGLVITRKRDRITFSNPGSFRIAIEAAKSGGISDPRNSALTKMFHLVDIGERAGNGLLNIYNIWNKKGFRAPVIKQSFKPERITLSLAMEKTKGKEQTAGAGKKVNGRYQQEMVIAYLTEHISAKDSEIAALLHISARRAAELLKELVYQDIAVVVGGSRSRIYKLKS